MHPLKIKKTGQMDYKALQILQKKEQKKIMINITVDTIAVGDFTKLK